MTELIKLYLDEDTISRALIQALRSRSVDLRTASEAGLMAVPDSEHLAYATSQNRTLFTFNTRDFVQLHIEYLSAGRHHAGIIVSDQNQTDMLLRRLLKLRQAKSAAAMVDWLEYLSNWQ